MKLTCLPSLLSYPLHLHWVLPLRVRSSHSLPLSLVAPPVGSNSTKGEERVLHRYRSQLNCLWHRDNRRRPSIRAVGFLSHFLLFPMIDGSSAATHHTKHGRREADDFIKQNHRGKEPSMARGTVRSPFRGLFHCPLSLDSSINPPSSVKGTPI